MGGYRLVCFDFDGTLAADYQGHSYWGTLHRELLKDEDGMKNGTRMRDYLDGRIGYREWMDLDLGDLREAGVTKEEFLRVAKLHDIMPGVEKVLEALREQGVKLAIVSGSLGIFIEALFPEHPFDDVFVNQVHFDDEGLIEGWEATIYDDGSKHKALHMICEREAIPLSETVFVGDGENDIDALREAGLGVAFRPKNEKVREAADVVIEELEGLLTHF